MQKMIKIQFPVPGTSSLLIPGSRLRLGQCFGLGSMYNLQANPLPLPTREIHIR
jgi:hypothetical protein